MSDFRDRFGETLREAATALAAEGVPSDFRERFGASLTAASIELAGAPAEDFRVRLGAQLGAAACALAQERAGAPAPRRRRAGALTGVRARVRRGGAVGPADFRARYGVALSAAARDLSPAPAATSTPPARARSRVALALMPRLSGPVGRVRLSLMPRLAKPLAVGVAFTALAGAATASSLWLVQVGNPNGGTNPGLDASPPPADQLSALAVLRRAQTAADRGPGVQTALEDINNFTTGVRSDYVRVLETTAAGPVVLVPVAQRDAAPAGTTGSSTTIDNALCVYYPDSGASALNQVPGCWSTSQVLSAQAFHVVDGHLFGLAPDGVSSVEVSTGTGADIDAPVTDNLFDVTLPASTTPVGGGGAPVPTAPPTVTFRSS